MNPAEFLRIIGVIAMIALAIGINAFLLAWLFLTSIGDF